MLSKEFGVTLIISSHILSEIEQMADTIGVIHNGKLIEEVPMGSIRNKQTEYIELATNDCTTAAFILENDLGLQNFKVIDDRLIRIYDSGVSQNDISRALINHNVAIEGISKKSKSLEEFFMNLTGGGGKSA